MKNYYVVKADVRGSKMMPTQNRQLLQEVMSQMVKLVTMSGRCVMSDLCCGDTMEVLCASREDAMWCLKVIKASLWKTGLHVGVGKGSWEIRIRGGGINAQDGHVFWDANDCLKRVNDATGNNAIWSSLGDWDYLDGYEKSQFDSEAGGFMDAVDGLPFDSSTDLLYDLMCEARPENRQGIKKVVFGRMVKGLVEQREICFADDK